MKKSKDKDSFIKRPEYPGGREAMQKFLGENLKYPKEALENKIEGKVYLTYRVEFDGSIHDIQILKGLGHGCDEEAKRVVSLLKFSPQKNRGGRVSVKRKLHVNFKLPKEPVKKKSVQYSYTVRTDTAKQTYSYTVNLKKK